jgi:hypothetical protein
VSGIAAGRHVDELEPLIAQPLNGHSQRLFPVLPEHDETGRDAVGRGQNEGFSAVREAAFPDGRGLCCPPVRAVQQAERRGSENVLERDEDRLPRQERGSAHLRAAKSGRSGLEIAGNLWYIVDIPSLWWPA